MSEQDESAPKQEPQMEEPPDTSWVEMEIIRKDNGTYETREQE